MAARKFVDLEEAAKMLGVAPDTLNEMRERHEISAYRDGGHWKFKSEDVEKLIADRGAAPSGEQDADFGELDDNLDSILLSEVELGGSSPSTSSTVIGKTNLPNPDSDIQLARPEKPDHGSSKLASSMSDVRLASESEVLASPGLSAKFSELDALDLDMPTPHDSGVGGSSTRTSASGISLADSGLNLGEEEHTATPGSGPGSGGLSGPGSAIDLAGEHDDDELVLGSGSSGSDLTHRAGDSGISLVDPQDSGLSLEEVPLQLGGSAVESLELGEDDMVLLEEEGDTESATQLKSDDDFLLTPLEDAGEDSDSGSQVIALDSEVEFDDAASTMVAGGASGAMLEEDTTGFGVPGGGMATRSPRADLGPAAALQPAAAPEAPYSLWNVLSLSLCLVILSLSGMFMYDVLRNMWSWNGPYRVDSAIMDTILKMFG